ncbi:MAG: metallophosphoesterase family protein [bacterium]
MRILACADLHGRPERIERVRRLVVDLAPEVVLLPGDLTHAGQGLDALSLLHTLPVPVLAVAGNMDDAGAVTAMRRHGALLEAEARVLGGVAFAGPEAEVPCDVLVVHEPPFGVLDTVRSGGRIGSPTVRDQMLRLRPRVLTCGHVHESPGVVRIGDTLVVNCTMGDGVSAGALIEIDADVTARLLTAPP